MPATPSKVSPNTREELKNNDAPKFPSADGKTSDSEAASDSVRLVGLFADRMRRSPTLFFGVSREILLPVDDTFSLGRRPNVRNRVFDIAEVWTGSATISSGVPEAANVIGRASDRASSSVGDRGVAGVIVSLNIGFRVVEGSESVGMESEGLESVGSTIDVAERFDAAQSNEATRSRARVPEVTMEEISIVIDQF